MIRPLILTHAHFIYSICMSFICRFRSYSLHVQRICVYLLFIYPHVSFTIYILINKILMINLSHHTGEKTFNIYTENMQKIKINYHLSHYSYIYIYAVQRDSIVREISKYLNHSHIRLGHLDV